MDIKDPWNETIKQSRKKLKKSIEEGKISYVHGLGELIL
jgi:hypothetical protein